MKLGVLISLTDQVEDEFGKVHQFDLPTCQLNCWEAGRFTEENALRVMAASLKFNIEVTSLWCGWEGPAVWDFIDGPLTLGLVPVVYRQARLQTLIKGADFAARIGAPSLTTHVGFIPENSNEIEYRSLVNDLRYLASQCKTRGLDFLFETGQETPVTLLRTIEDIGLDNLGINFDPANLILYGKGNPIDALDVFGKYVRGMHAKDGLYPTSGRFLGKEVPLGDGKVNIKLLVKRLKELGYDGSLTIEREITGPQQINDILAAKRLLETLL